MYCDIPCSEPNILHQYPKGLTSWLVAGRDGIDRCSLANSTTLQPLTASPDRWAGPRSQPRRQSCAALYLSRHLPTQVGSSTLCICASCSHGRVLEGFRSLSSVARVPAPTSPFRGTIALLPSWLSCVIRLPPLPFLSDSVGSVVDTLNPTSNPVQNLQLDSFASSRL